MQLTAHGNDRLFDRWIERGYDRESLHQWIRDPKTKKRDEWSPAGQRTTFLRRFWVSNELWRCVLVIIRPENEQENDPGVVRVVSLYPENKR